MPGLSSLYLANSAGFISICRCVRGNVVLGVGAGLWCPPKLLGLAGPALNSNNCRILRTLGDRIDDAAPKCCDDNERTGTEDRPRVPPNV